MSEAADKRGWIWPLGITLGLLLVVGVNATMIWIAVSGEDAVVPSYNVGHR
jgi:hypothetical protein